MSNKALMKLEESGTAGQGELTQLVSFMLSDEEYGVEVLKVREIIRMPPIRIMQSFT